MPHAATWPHPDKSYTLIMSHSFPCCSKILAGLDRLFWIAVTGPFVCASITDSREETVLGSIPLPSYVIAPVEPDDHINRKYAFKVKAQKPIIKKQKTVFNGHYQVNVFASKCIDYFLYYL